MVADTVVVDSMEVRSMLVVFALVASMVCMAGMAGGLPMLTEVGPAMAGTDTVGTGTVGTAVTVSTAVSPLQSAAGLIGVTPTIIRLTIRTDTDTTGVIQADGILLMAAHTERPTLPHTTTFVTPPRFIRTRLRRTT